MEKYSLLFRNFCLDKIGGEPVLNRLNFIKDIAGKPLHFSVLNVESGYNIIVKEQLISNTYIVVANLIIDTKEKHKAIKILFQI